MKNYSPNSFWLLQFFFSSKTRLEKSCWITLIIGMMSHQMSNVSFRVGDFNSFEESWSSPRENSKKIYFIAKKLEFCEIIKIKKKWITVIRVRLQHHLHSVHHQHQAEFTIRTFFWWRHLKNFASIHVMRFWQFASKQRANVFMIENHVMKNFVELETRNSRTVQLYRQNNRE